MVILGYKTEIEKFFLEKSVLYAYIQNVFEIHPYLGTGFVVKSCGQLM